MKGPMSANSTISSKRLLDLAALHVEDRAVQEDVLAAGELGMEAGADLEQRADPAVAGAPRPSVGGVIRERILSSVLLPAPLWPITPNVSPRFDLEVDVLQRPELLRSSGAVPIDLNRSVIRSVSSR